ncbi:MAG TPA: hypothetical protein PLN69_08830 [bacterium]|nr:hypothetical protein [bacterium]
MSGINLTQEEAELLIMMDKKRKNDNVWKYPAKGQKVSIPIISMDNKEDFFLDISKGSIDIKKIKYQERCRKTEVLIRLDLGGHPHRNPDDTEIGAPHLHYYKEGYGDKWAKTIPANLFSNLSDEFKTLKEFMKYCNIIVPPIFVKEQQELAFYD